MKLVPTRRTDYGLRALIHLANADGALAKAGAIGSAMDVPTGFLQQVLQELQRARLVTSRPGPHGGYGLARPAASITIREIVEALEGSFDTGECALRGGPCHWDEVCAIHWVWSSARAALCEQLQAATLAQVAADDRALAEGRAVVPEDSHRRPRPVPAATGAAGRARPSGRARPGAVG